LNCVVEGSKMVTLGSWKSTNTCELGTKGTIS